MHSWVIKNDDYYAEIPENLRRSVPEFSSIWEDHNIYLMLFEFGEFFIQNINDEKIRIHLIKFINDALENGGYMTEDAVVVQIFHQIYEFPELFDKVKASMSEKSTVVFDRFYEEYKRDFK